MNKYVIYLIIFLIFAGLIAGFYFFHKSKTDELKKSLHEYGQHEVINDSLQSYIAYVSPLFESVLNTNKYLNDKIKQLQENPEVITVYKTNTVIKEIEVPTFPDTSKKDTRNATYKDAWLTFGATYTTKAPFQFMISNISIRDSYELIQTQTSSGRVKVYLQNHNPYVKTSELESYIDPVGIEKIIEKNYWEWSVNSSYVPNSQKINISAGIYAPFGIGINAGLNEMEVNKYNIGIGFLKKF